VESDDDLIRRANEIWGLAQIHDPHEAEFRKAIAALPAVTPGGGILIPPRLVPELISWAQGEQQNWPIETQYQRDLAAFLAALDLTPQPAPIPHGERCPKCNWNGYANCDELQPNGRYAPAPLRRCEECKTVYDPRPQPAPIPTSNCVICGRLVDTREVSEGGDGHGCEYPEGWTCSSECAEKLHPDPDWMKTELEKPAPDVAGLRVAMVTSSLWIDEQEGRAGDLPDEPCVVLCGSLEAVQQAGKLLGERVALAAMEGKP
jgi:hypothetical protein